MTYATRALYAVMVALMPCSAAAQTGPTSELYLTNYGGSVYVVQGDNVINSWSNPVGSVFDASTAIAVTSTVRTFGQGFVQQSLGYEFTLGGTATGATYANTLGCCFRDGTTDGVYNYALRDPGGDSVVYRFDLDWSNPEIFDLSFNFAGNSQIFSIGDVGGITWDPRDNSFWLAGDSSLFNVGSTGEILAFFLLSVTSPRDYALAFDAADNTLWLSASGATGDTLYQYDAAKIFARVSPLDTLTLDGVGLVGGAEFALATPAVPEPASWAMMLMGFGAVGFSLRRRKRMASPAQVA